MDYSSSLIKQPIPPFLRALQRIGISALEAPQKKKNQQDDQDGAEYAARRITPTAAVRPSGNCTNQQQNDHNQ